MKRSLLALFLIAAVILPIAAQTADFRAVVEKRLKDDFNVVLTKICPIDTDPVAERVFRDYGSIFISKTDGPIPSSCLMKTEAMVRSFQSSVPSSTADIGGTRVTLQTEAMEDLQKARKEAAKVGLNITPRGGSAASARSFGMTVNLWRSRFEPALRYWTAKRRISATEAAEARRASLDKQVAMVLAWEEQKIYFAKDLSKSILYSVAIPGASQHNFMLALDVEQYADRRVRDILAQHGWFQTVRSDLPHFTYLGVKKKDLPKLGLERVMSGSQEFWIPNY